MVCAPSAPASKPMLGIFKLLEPPDLRDQITLARTKLLGLGLHRVHVVERSVIFGSVSHGLAMIVEKAVSQWGLPNGYILGEEASGAFVGGLRYGNGMLYTRNAGDLRVFAHGALHRIVADALQRFLVRIIARLTLAMTAEFQCTENVREARLSRAKTLAIYDRWTSLHAHNVSRKLNLHPK